MRRFFKWLCVTAVFLVVLPAIGIGVLRWRADAVEQDSILRVVLDGGIDEAPRANVGQLLAQHPPPTLHQLAQGIRHAAHDPRIAGLLLDVRQPQVGVAQIEEIDAAVAEFRQSGKWNVAFVETVGEAGHGDGAYALACGAANVVLAPPGEVHLSGLRSDATFYKETLARARIGAYTEQRYEYKSYADAFHETAFTDAHKEALKGVLDDLQETLVHIVAKNRNADTQTVKRWITEAPHAAEAALSQHMVDRLAYWDEVLDMARDRAGRDEPFMEAERYCTRARGPKGGVPVALIIAAGEIDRGESSDMPWSQGPHLGSETFAQALRDARDDEVAAVLLRIDSPGGSYVASDVIRREVQRTRDANIPVVVSMGNTAASGGYMIATDADHIVAEAGTVTGSIGVLSAAFSVRQALHHWFGLNVDSYSTLPHAGTLDWLDPPTEEDRARYSASVDRVYRDFVTKVAAGRHTTYDAVHAVAKGRIWSGRQAVARGLADELGGFEQATAYLRRRLHLAAGEHLDMILYPEAPSALSALRDLVGAQARLRSVLANVWGEAEAAGLRPRAPAVQARSSMPAIVP